MIWGCDYIPNRLAKVRLKRLLKKIKYHIGIHRPISLATQLIELMEQKGKTVLSVCAV